MLTRRDFLKRSCLAVAATLPVRALLAAPAAGSAQGRPNVLFIMTDQQFAEAMSCRMGKTYLHTPVMDGLAENGTLFSRAYSPNPLCMPMRASSFTGRYPHETGVMHNAPARMDTKDFVCLGTYFRQAGYETAYFGKWHLCYNEKDKEAHGFETLDTNARDPATADNAVRFLSGKPAHPFLLVVSLLNPHNICEFSRDQKLPCGPIGNPPPPDQCPPVPANLAPPQNETDTMTLMRQGYHASPLFPVGNFSPDKWRQYRWAYYRLIEKVDGELGRVLEALNKAGMAENTAIVFTADHGECAGAHGFNQKTVFYEESARVPLIVSHKGKTKKGVCDRLVNTGIDILPTLLDFAGIPQPKKLTGRSLRPIALGETPAAWRDHVVVENDMVQTGPVGDIAPHSQGRMVRSERYKYCLYEKGNRREELFDLEKDPLETANLAADPAHRQVLLEHRDLLRKFAAETRDALAEAMLAGNVAPNPFQPGEPGQDKGGGKKKKKEKSSP